MKSGNLNFLKPSGPLQACNGTALPLPVEIQNPVALEPDRQQHDRLAASVIAQQYFSTTFLWLRFHSRNIYIYIYIYIYMYMKLL